MSRENPGKKAGREKWRRSDGDPSAPTVGHHVSVVDSMVEVGHRLGRGRLKLPPRLG